MATLPHRLCRSEFMGLALLLALALPVAAAPAQIFVTAAGPVTITPIYHATAMIQAGNDRIYIDPANPANIAGLAPGDLIVITDIHGDHMDPADVKALSKPGTIIIAPGHGQGLPVRHSTPFRGAQHKEP